MPKVSKAPKVPKPSSTDRRRVRACKVVSGGVAMVPGCARCRAENLRCFVEASTGRCAACISVHAECSLFVPEKEWEKVQREKREKRLALLRSEAEVARLRLELAEAEDRERSYANQDLRVLSVIDSAQEMDDPKGTETSGGPSTPQPEPTSADLGWLQADPLSDLFDPLLLDFSSFLATAGLPSPGAADDTSVPVSCSS